MYERWVLALTPAVTGLVGEVALTPAVAGLVGKAALSPAVARLIRKTHSSPLVRGGACVRLAGWLFAGGGVAPLVAATGCGIGPLGVCRFSLGCLLAPLVS